MFRPSPDETRHEPAWPGHDDDAAPDGGRAPRWRPGFPAGRPDTAGDHDRWPAGPGGSRPVAPRRSGTPARPSTGWDCCPGGLDGWAGRPVGRRPEQGPGHRDD
jgi:hypothetical protein